MPIPITITYFIRISCVWARVCMNISDRITYVISILCVRACMCVCARTRACIFLWVGNCFNPYFCQGSDLHFLMSNCRWVSNVHNMHPSPLSLTTRHPIQYPRTRDKQSILFLTHAGNPNSQQRDTNPPAWAKVWRRKLSPTSSHLFLMIDKLEATKTERRLCTGKRWERNHKTTDPQTSLWWELDLHCRGDKTKCGGYYLRFRSLNW